MDSSNFLQHQFPQDCVFCGKFELALQQQGPDIYEPVNFGSLHRALSNRCRQHEPLAAYLSAQFAPLDTTHDLHLHWFHHTSSFYFSSETRLSASYKSSSVLQLNLLEHDEELQHRSHGVKVHPNWIDANKIVQWYKDCTEAHGDQCCNPPYLKYLPLPNPTYLIDTIRDCLCPAPVNASYVALSYVWGRAGAVKAFQSNLDQLQIPGVFRGSPNNNLVTLPKTICHAVHLTRLLGVRYLWVDSLCILQDDEESQNDHLNRMASIYAHADVVIVSIDGEDSDHGLHGLENAPSAEPRHLEQKVIPLGTMEIIERTEFSNESPRSSTKKDYFGRGWTFQEFLFARKRLCFEADSVWFQCCDSTRFEDHALPGRALNERDFILRVDYPSLTVYSRLVEDFNQRHLTYPQDCLSAISGVLPCYTKAFDGGFLCGLPEMFFDAALLWQPGGDLARREPVCADKRYSFANEDLPSWSWIGWQGKLHFEGWATANDFVAGCSGWIATTQVRTEPVTTWYTGSDASGDAAEKRKINVSWSTWRERYKDKNVDLPDGWVKRKREPSDTLTIPSAPEGYGEYLYWHYRHRLEGQDFSSFWYPVPIADSEPQPRLKLQTRFLFASVETATLYASSKVHLSRGKFESYEVPYVTLTNSKQEWAGVLWLHSRDYLSEDGLHPAATLVKVQLVAISRGSIPNNLEESYGDSHISEYSKEERPRDGAFYEFYNVMWVKWTEGIAYREGLGRVYRRMWKSSKPSVISLVLG